MATSEDYPLEKRDISHIVFLEISPKALLLPSDFAIRLCIVVKIQYRKQLDTD